MVQPFDEKLTRQQIVLKGEGYFEEAQAEGLEVDGSFGAVAIYPGMGIHLNSDLTLGLGIEGAVRIAIEANLVGKSTADGYPGGSRVFYYIPQMGDEVLLLVASGEEVAAGDMLTPAASGLWAVTGAGGYGLFEVQETIDGALDGNSLVIAKMIPRTLIPA